MAQPSYAEMTTMAEGQVRNTAKPVFIKESDIFGVRNPPKEQWLSHVEVYKAMARIVPAENIAGLQRVRSLWRIYMDSNDTRDLFLTSEFCLRGKSIPVYESNPGNIFIEQDNITRVRIKNVPLSADDGQIRRALSLKGCNLKNMFREKLRVDGRLTNCETGDRIALVSDLSDPLPKFMEIGRYRAVIVHKGQVNDKLKCTKCLGSGHISKDCRKEVVCHACKMSGHLMADCPESLNQDQEEETSSSDESESDPIIEDTEAEQEHPRDRDPTPNRDIHTDDEKQPKQSGSTNPQTKVKKNSKRDKGTKDPKPNPRGTLDSFIQNKGSSTPHSSRKSSSISKEVRSPLSPLNDDRSSKKSKDTD